MSSDLSSLDRNSPAPDKTSFVCPHCETFAQQGSTASVGLAATVRVGATNLHVPLSEQGWAVTQCQNCNDIVIYRHGETQWPRSLLGPIPPDDLSAPVRAIYEEARAVGNSSPRSAAALLRLALEELVNELDESNDRLNDKVGALVKRGLAPQVQQAMDSLRVYGNNGAHIGEIDLSDDRETVLALFRILHLVVDHVVTRQRQVDALYSRLPASVVANIERRDGTQQAQPNR